jgi:hypothetical protein
LTGIGRTENNRPMPDGATLTMVVSIVLGKIAAT